MQPQDYTPQTLAEVRAQLLDSLKRESAPIEVTESGLVTVTMTEHMTVSALTLPDDLAAADRAALTQALIDAFNHAKTELGTRRRLRYDAAMEAAQTRPTQPQHSTPPPLRPPISGTRQGRDLGRGVG